MPTVNTVTSIAHPSLNHINTTKPQHPWPTGYIFQSPGGQFSYRVIGPCCRLYDREQLPWPCCRLQWHSKEPSWRRIGRRFVVDMATRRYASYCVELLNYGRPGATVIMTLYTMRLPPDQQNWWCSKLRAPQQ